MQNISNIYRIKTKFLNFLQIKLHQSCFSNEFYSERYSCSLQDIKLNSCQLLRYKITNLKREQRLKLQDHMKAISQNV